MQCAIAVRHARDTQSQHTRERTRAVDNTFAVACCAGTAPEAWMVSSGVRGIFLGPQDPSLSSRAVLVYSYFGNMPSPQTAAS
jgi:hypothetical protein